MISRKAGEAVLKGAHVFVPGVLAVTAGLERGHRVAVTVALEQEGRWVPLQDQGFEGHLAGSP